MTKDKPVVVAVSGGFDPIHPGHVRMFEEARALGDKLVVILNNDNWLEKKKRFSFMGEKERKEVVEAIRYVDEVVLTRHPKNPEDMSVCEALARIKPDIFANGGDRVKSNIPEVALCQKLGIKMVFNVGEGGKIQSSSSLVDKAMRNAPRKIEVNIKKKK
jgi:cytidyltransferase-like protein